MKYDLPSNNLYSNRPVQLDIPDNWDVRICSFKNEKKPALKYGEIKDIIAKAQPSIVQQARGCHRAVIIVDDITRPTPCGQIAKAVICQLHRAGLKDEEIHFVFATGMHRAMSREETVRKLGNGIVSKYKVYSHNPFFNCINIGTTSQGVPVEVNRDVYESDYKIAIGSLTPHGAVGIGGGSKIILPGVASAQAIKAFHCKNGQDRWNIDSIGKKMTDEFAETVGLNMKIDVLLNGRGEICDLFAGKPSDIITEHYDEIKQAFETDYDLDADVILINNYFKPSETKLAVGGNGMLKHLKKGTIVIVSSNTPQGNAPHYLFGRWGENDQGGLLYKGLPPVRNNIEKYIVFSKYMDKGNAESWHYGGEKVVWARTWQQVVSNIPDGKHRMVIYPYASVAFFGESGNVMD